MQAQAAAAAASVVAAAASTARGGVPSAVTAPRISVMEYAAERVQEIQALCRALTSAVASGAMRRTFQRLPKHMRRRAMAHNVHRIPRRVRAAALRELEHAPLPKKTPSRKAKRKPRELRLAHLRRAALNCWLETHLWFAKRFFMANRWGLRLPVRPTNKGARAAVRQAARSCCVADVSYWTAIAVRGTCALEALAAVLDPRSQRVLRFAGGSAASQAGESTVSVVDAAGRLLGPALLSRSPAWTRAAAAGRALSVSDVAAVLWLHAAAKGECLARMTEAGVPWLPLTAKRLRAMGPRAGEIVARCVGVASLGDPLSARQRHLLVERVSWRSPVAFKVPRDDTSARTGADHSGCGAGSSDGSSVAGGGDAWTSFWKSQYDDAVRPAASSVPDAETEAEAARRATASSPALVVAHVSGTHASTRGWDMVVPAGAALPAWVSLVHTGGHAVGVDDMRSVYNQAGLPCFPFDSIDAAAHVDLVRAVVTKSLAKYVARPPSKRGPPPAFPKLPDARQRVLLHAVDIERAAPALRMPTGAHFAVGSPASAGLHSPPDEHLYVHCELCCDTGEPETLAVLAAPLAADLDLRRTRASSLVVREHPRADVGHVTSGFFSFRHGRGAGVCAVRLEALLALQREQGNTTNPVVLFRSPRARKWRFGTLTLVADAVR